jgi:hypothetical protein
MSTFGTNKNRRSTFLNQDGQGRDGVVQQPLSVEQNLVEIKDKVDKVEADVIQVQNELRDSVDLLSDQVTSLVNAQTQGLVPDVVQVGIQINSGHNMIGYTGPSGVGAITAFQNSSINIFQLGKISVIKNDAADMYLPQYGFSNLTMEFGQGYYLYNEGEPFTLRWTE